MAVVFGHMAAAWACAAGVLWWYGDEVAAVPLQLVVQLTTELEPSLVEDAFVQARLGPNVFTRLLSAACR